ncbi:MAG TPA: RDD family protein [Gaiellaceae bacterium]|jgi:uncharacterized RDD family membrane protein YckC|nr:RDD family protein [Gaiellaceae bacterium]
MNRRSRFGTAGRLAFYPARAAARASRGPLEAALAESFPEELVDSLVEHRVLERMAAELARTGALDRMVDEALASPRTSELVDRVVASPELRRAVREIAASREVREAVAQQTTGFVEELAAEVRRWARGLDGRIGKRPAAATPYGGVVTRALALSVDVLLIVVVFTAVSGFVALISSLVGTLRPTWLVGALLGGGWVLLGGAYLVLFWSAAGRTPGMQLLKVRVRVPTGGPPGVGRSIVRALATWVSIVPFFAGYLPVLFDRRRRGLPDLVAGTEVVYAEPDG